jgi:hypothetical protein
LRLSCFFFTVKYHHLKAAITKHQLERYQNLLVAGCAEDNLDYIANDITTTRAYSAEQCQKHCKNSTACRFWTWGKPAFHTNANSCFLKDYIQERKTNYNTTSGIGDCSGKKIMFLDCNIVNTTCV